MSTRRCIATTWRLPCVKFHNNAQNQFNVEKNTAAQIPYSLVGRVPLGSQNMKELELGDITSTQSKIRETVNVTPLVLHMDTFTCEKILTNDPTRHERKNVTIQEMLARSDSWMQKFEQKSQKFEQERQKAEQKSQTLLEKIQKLEKKSQKAEQESQKAEQERQKAKQERQKAEQERQKAEQKSQILSEEIQQLKYRHQASWKEIQNLKEETRDLKDDKKRRHAGEVVNIRDKLAQFVLSPEVNEQRKQQLHDPKDMKAMKEVRNRLAHEIDLSTTLEQMATYPDQFDICSITVFGETQNKIRELLTWDKDRECEVYNIFNERGEAWYNQFANTCVEPFNNWLSAIYTLKETESAMLENPFADFESRIQKQKDGIKKAIREWNETFMMDKSQEGKATRMCQEAIMKDYKDRGLIDRIEAALLQGVILAEKSKKIEEIMENGESGEIEKSGEIKSEVTESEEGKNEAR